MPRGRVPLPGPGKLTTLREAIVRHIRPGQVIHAGSGWGFPTCLLHEILRQYWGKDPGFTLAAAGAASTNVVPFLRGRLVRRVISSFAGDGYPHPGPNPIIQEARRSRQVDFEDWSLLTFTLRLVAGAMNLPFFPTRSLVGSDLGRDAERAGLFSVLGDPFAGGDSDARPVGLVKALRPDVSLVHAWAADLDGNALFTLPLAGNLYGALAAREGVVLSAERIVDRGFLARHSDLVRLPGGRVLAVVEAPFGAHPTGLHHQGLRHEDPIPARGYAEDRDFILEVREACGSPEAIDRWIRDWILDSPDHDAYLDKLGATRLKMLEERLAEEAWPGDLPSAWEGLEPPDTPLTPGERLIGLAAGVVAEEIRRTGSRPVLAGVGAAHLACWQAREELAAEGLDFDLMAEVGLVGHRPYPGDPFVFSLRNVPTAPMTTDILTVLGMLVPEAPGAGRSGPGCLGVIGAAQVDMYGNVNSSGAPGAGLWLVGSGGANDVASAAASVIVVAAQSPTRFVPKVAYVTSPGERVTAIVSQHGVFRRLTSGDSRASLRRGAAGGTAGTGHGAAGGEFALAAYYDDPDNPGPDAAIRRAKEKCGWPLRVFPHPSPLPPLRPGRIRSLRRFDPRGDLR